MPPPVFNFRRTIYATILVCYLLPIALYSRHCAGLLSPDRSWGVLSTGLLISIFASAAIILLVRNWELWMYSQLKVVVNAKVSEQLALEPQQQPIDFPTAPFSDKITPIHAVAVDDEQVINLERALDASRSRQEQLSEELTDRNNETRQFQALHRELQQELELQRQELVRLQTQIQEHDQQQNQADAEQQHIINEQRATLEQKQHLITKLETEVQDLRYEVRTLLQLGDMEQEPRTINNPNQISEGHPALDTVNNNDPQHLQAESSGATLEASSERHVQTPYDATLQLQRSIEIAQGFKGAAHLSDGTGRFKALSIDSDAIDLRRLCDTLRSETSAVILLYSPSQDKILFVNNQIKGLLGWSPEKFSKDFYHTLQQGAAEWKSTISQLDGYNERQLPLVIKAKSGRDVLLYCHLNVIPEGVFTNHVIAILYPA